MFILRIIFNNKIEEKCILTEFVKFEKENGVIYMVAYNEMQDDNASDFSEDYKNIEYININHFCYYKMDEFYEAYNSLSSSRRTFGSLVNVSDIQNKLLSNQEEKIFKEVNEKYKLKEKDNKNNHSKEDTINTQNNNI